MEIYTKDFIEYLKHNKINFEIIGNYQEKYLIASIFQPIRRGFYFLTGKTIPIEIKESLILCSLSPITSREEEQNVKIVIKENPQLIFYSFLEYKYSPKSSGKISKTTNIHPQAQLGKNIQIDDFCVIGKCTIEDNVIIGSHTYIHDNSYIGKNSIIESQSVIGATGVAWIWDKEEENKIILPQLGGVYIGNYCFLGANTIIVRGSLNENTKIGNQSVLAPSSRIGHGTKIGESVHFANNVITGGNTVIGNNCFVGSAAVFRPKVNIHPHTIVGAGTVVVKDTSDVGLTLVGVPAKEVISKKLPAGMPKPKNIKI